MEHILRSLWNYRAFIWGMVSRDLHTQYLNSLLGTVWAVLIPLAQIVIYTLVFSHVMKAKLPGIDDTMGYSIYLCAGQLPWQYFSEVLNRNINIFIDQATLLKKVNFPRSTLPIYVLLSGTVNFCIIFGLFLFFLLVTGRLPGWSLLALLPLLLIQQVLAVGMGIFLGTFNVFFRDVGHVVGIVLQFWFWLTPIVYPLAAVPEHLRWILNINPMLSLIEGYQGIFLHNAWPNWITVAPAALWAGFFLIAGYFIFIKLSNEMVDEL